MFEVGDFVVYGRRTALWRIGDFAQYGQVPSKRVRREKSGRIGRNLLRVVREQRQVMDTNTAWHLL